MTHEEFNGKINNLLTDPEFAQELKNANNVEEMAELFNANGIAITADVITESLKAAQETGELKEDDLEEVSGGFWGIISAGIAIVKGALDLAPGGKYSKQVQSVFDYWYKRLH